jgi:hypothetical protein
MYELALDVLAPSLLPPHHSVTVASSPRSRSSLLGPLDGGKLLLVDHSVPEPVLFSTDDIQEQSAQKGKKKVGGSG